MTQLKRIRWGVRAALFLGVAASITGNVLHAQDNLISQAISAWSPIALLITIELISRIPVHRQSLALARWAATALIAGIAAWVSYWHMAAVAQRYGETDASPFLLPLSVDGLVVVASICLVELAGRIRDADNDRPAPVDVSTATVSPPPSVVVLDYDRPIGPDLPPAPVIVDKLSSAKPVVRKRPPSSEDRVVAAHKRTPNATDAELAARLGVSEKTVQRWRPAKPEEPKRINGSVPALSGVGASEKES